MTSRLWQWCGSWDCHFVEAFVRAFAPDACFLCYLAHAASFGDVADGGLQHSWVVELSCRVEVCYGILL